MSFFTNEQLRLGAVQTRTGYPGGVDFSTFWAKDGSVGMDPNWTPILSGDRILLEHVVRRWIIRPGEMHDASIGAGLFGYVNKALSPLQVGKLQAKLKEQALAVEGVEDCKVQIGLAPGYKLAVRAEVKLSAGQQWTLVLGLNETTIQILSAA